MKLYDRSSMVDYFKIKKDSIPLAEVEHVAYKDGYCNKYHQNVEVEDE